MSPVGRNSELHHPFEYFLPLVRGHTLFTLARALSIFDQLSTIFKGQLISKCPFGFIISTKIPTEKFNRFCPRGRSQTTFTRGGG